MIFFFKKKKKKGGGGGGGGGGGYNGRKETFKLIRYSGSVPRLFTIF